MGNHGEMEAAVHSLRTFIVSHGEDPDLCCFQKTDMANAFNNCHHSKFLQCLQIDLPELYALSLLCYLCFGSHVLLKSSGGAQQSDPLGPQLFPWRCEMP